jgi:hypothetical protein
MGSWGIGVDELRQSLSGYISAMKQVAELRKSAMLRVRASVARSETHRQEWELSGPHSPEDTETHAVLLNECASILRELTSSLQSTTDEINVRNDEMYDRAQTMCNDPEVDPSVVLAYLREEFSKRMAEFPSYEKYFTRVDEAYAKLDAFIPSQHAHVSPQRQKKSWRR